MGAGRPRLHRHHVRDRGHSWRLRRWRLRGRQRACGRQQGRRAKPFDSVEQFTRSGAVAGAIEPYVVGRPHHPSFALHWIPVARHPVRDALSRIDPPSGTGCRKPPQLGISIRCTCAATLGLLFRNEQPAVAVSRLRHGLYVVAASRTRVQEHQRAAG